MAGRECCTRYVGNTARTDACNGGKIHEQPDPRVELPGLSSHTRLLVAYSCYSYVATSKSSISSHSRYRFLRRNACTTVSWFDTVDNAIYCCTLALVRPFMLAGRWWCIHILTRLLTIHQSIRTRRLGVAKSVFIRVYTVVGPSVPKALATC